ncbi:hypothetical protein [Dongia deserti]|uniref:hypothetical protein n=1 Tax=Dongia deserti TaxID=2268030 RepID=UPI0013C5369A|nr:hypothetical protein [Dongia deserti]
MSGPLVITFVAACALLLVWGLLERNRIYQYPFLAGAVFAAFILPQILGLSHDRFLPVEALESTLVLAILSAFMCWLGAAVARPIPPADVTLDDGRLLLASAGLSAMGGYFYFALSRLPPEMLSNTQWTGLPVAYLFFARALTYGFALAVFLYARNRSKWALLIALYGAFFCLDRIIIGGRRHDLVEFAVIILVAVWFQRGWCLPRSAMLAGVVMGALFINSIGDYRSATMNAGGPSWERIGDIDFVGNLSRITESGGAEVRNAAYNIAAVSRSMKLDFGLAHWNALVFSYVPAQLVGKEFKQSLFINLPQPALEEYFYRSPVGSTWTGLSDSFQSFWYFGALKFFAIAYIMQKLWLAASSGSQMAQIIYMLIPAYAMEAITHTTHYFVDPWVHMAIFLLPALMWARNRRREPSLARSPAEAAPLQRP